MHDDKNHVLRHLQDSLVRDPEIIVIEEDRSGLTADQWERMGQGGVVTSTCHDGPAFAIPAGEERKS